jgi:hypothetical protein
LNPERTPLTKANAKGSTMANNTIPVQERWLPVPGYEGIYEVSDQGRVKSLARVIKRNSGRDNPIPERILKPIMSRRYPAVSLYGPNGFASPTIHALVMRAFVGPMPEGMQVAHNNGDRNDNRLCNLRYATAIENNLDKFAHGTVLRGEQIANAAIDDEKVRAIRKIYAEGQYSQQWIAAQFGITQSTVSAVVLRKTWAHVD